MFDTVPPTTAGDGVRVPLFHTDLLRPRPGVVSLTVAGEVGTRDRAATPHPTPAGLISRHPR